MFAGLYLGLLMVFLFFVFLAFADLWLCKNDSIRITFIGCLWIAFWLIIAMVVGEHSNLQLLITNASK